VFNAVGDTVAVTVVDDDAIEALQSDEVLSVRPNQVRGRVIVSA
jgi:hypothetical protein